MSLYRNCAVVSTLVFFFTLIVTFTHLESSIVFAGDNATITKEFTISGTASDSIVLEQSKLLKIFATGVGPINMVSEVTMKVMAMPDIVVITENISLRKGETQSWEVPPEKHPYNLRVVGKSGQIKFKIYQ